MPDARPVTAAPPYDGGCACGQVRYRMTERPLFVHCCHCTRCQRETGGPFAHHVMIEFSHWAVTAGEPEFVLVPTDSGGKHWVARCPTCRTALWNEHGSRTAITRYVRVGTFDAPNAFPPRAHIYVRSKQEWVRLDDAVPAFRSHYDAGKVWPADSLARYEAARALRAEQRRSATAATPARSARPPTGSTGTAPPQSRRRTSP
jgi:hypothetical protein